MITVITGTPGVGKTAAAISMLLQMSDRPIFVDGISDLRIEHYACPPFDEWTKYVDDPSTEDGKKLAFNFPENAVVVVDEAQRKFRPAGSGAKIPPVIAALETHRHDGIDFILITQGPHLLHSNVRLLTGRHVHIRDVGVLGRWWYEFPECSCPPSFRTAPVKKRYRLPRSTFELYRSASFHTKHRQPIPTALKILFLAIGVLAFIGYQYYGSFTHRLALGQSGEQASSAKDRVISISQIDDETKTKVDSSVPITKVTVDSNSSVLLDTSPPVREKGDLDDVGACIAGNGYCKCYSRQGHRMNLTLSACLDRISSPLWIGASRNFRSSDVSAGSERAP